MTKQKYKIFTGKSGTLTRYIHEFNIRSWTKTVITDIRKNKQSIKVSVVINNVQDFSTGDMIHVILNHTKNKEFDEHNLIITDIDLLKNKLTLEEEEKD